jgi:RNA polymerase sigma-70 factor, ECF subfamily
VTWRIFNAPPSAETLDRFERLAKPQLDALFRTALRLTGHRADAEDLVHDACLKAFRSAGAAGELEGVENVRAWLFRVMMNTYLDQYRRRRRSPDRKSSTWTEADDSRIVELVASPDPRPDALLEQRQFAAAADAAISELPPDVKAVVILFFLEDLTYQQIADTLDCPLGTVMSRLWRGRRFLRSRLVEFAPAGFENKDDNPLKTNAKDQGRAG